MKQFLITLSDAIKNGILRIFPKPLLQIFSKIFVWMSSIYDAILQKLAPKSKRIVCALLLGFWFLILIGCSTQRQVVTQLVEHSKVDTIYLSNVQYDSIYIYQDKLVDRSKDTLYIKDKSIEFRYKLLRDTIYKTRVDSIPYQVMVTEVKEITRPLTWFDHLTRACFFILLGIVGYYIIRLIRKFYPL